MTLTEPDTDVSATKTVPASRHVRRPVGLLVLAIALLALVLLSIAIGAKTIGLSDVVHGLLHDDGSDNAAIVRSLRVPRTLVGLAAGAALGLAGALMQALTRNPLADPGLLGINAGAAAAVVVGIGTLGVTSPAGYLWLALVGASVASLLVYLLGSRGRAAATPARLALAGAAVSAAFVALVNGLTITDPRTFNDFRFWQVGSLVRGQPLAVLAGTGPFLLVGALLALGLARSLNALALGDDAGQALGAHVGRARLLGFVAVTLLAGGATATAGPIAFVGLVVPHAVRTITGPDQRWILPYSMVLAPALLLASDIVGRVIARPGEIEVGIVTAFVGAPVFIALVRRRRLMSL